MKERYQSIRIGKEGLERIDRINGIIAEYQKAGYTLTLRQVYYQLVARAIIENTEKSYTNVGNLVNNGRLAGLIDWDAIEDRTREIRMQPTWDSPAEILEVAAKEYRINLWAYQPNYLEVWVEKDALIAVVEKAANRFNVPCFSCRGYTSQTAMYESAMRFIDESNGGKECVLIYLGDHDPSGLDMTRDIRERLSLFGAKVDVRRIALNRDQIELYSPPVNPAKITDTRAKEYIKEHGVHSWELDALKPDVIDGLIADAIKVSLDQEMFDYAKRKEGNERQSLRELVLSIDKQ